MTETPIAVWEADRQAQRFRDEWHEVKAQFVDEPESALTAAHDLVTEAVHELAESLLAEQRRSRPAARDGAPDTEACAWRCAATASSWTASWLSEHPQSGPRKPRIPPGDRGSALADCPARMNSSSVEFNS